MKKLIPFAVVGLLLFWVATDPHGMADVFRAAGGLLGGVARGTVTFLGDLA